MKEILLLLMVQLEKYLLVHLEVVDPELSGDFGTLMTWADKYRKLGVRTNADTPHDAEVARKFGAEGIGLCRTEHMFFAEDRIKAVREMILADDLDGRKKALAKLLPFQKEDFIGIIQSYGRITSNNKIFRSSIA